MSEQGRWEVFIEQEDYARRMTLRVGRSLFDGFETFSGAARKKYEPGELADDGGLTSLASDEMRGFLKAIMDEAWRIGVRPSESTADTVIAAKDRHLQDMRALAFHKIGAELPK